MAKAILLVGFIFLGGIAWSQQIAIDSLEALLEKTEADTNRVNILCDLSDKYLAYLPPKAKYYAEEALKLSKEISYPQGEILALNRLGENEFRQGKYARAVDFTSRSLHLAEDLNDSTLMALAYQVLGNINNFGLKRYDSALNYQLKAFKIHERHKNYEELASVCGSITWIYATTNQNLVEAHRLADLGIYLSDSLHHPQFLSYNYNSKGLIYKQEGKLDSALKYIDLSILVAEDAKDKSVIAMDKRIKASIYLLQGNFKQAIDLYNIALAESRQLNIREVVKNSYEGLAKSYVGLSNYPLAYKYNVLFNQLKDSLLNAEITQKTLVTELEFEERKREAKIAELEQANEQAQTEKIIYSLLFGTGFLLMVTVVLLIMRNNRQRIKTNELLLGKNTKIAEQNFKLQEVNSTKDKLFSIIGHDLRGPLASLKRMLGMVVRNEITDEEFKQFAPKLNGQVIGINEMLENLLQWSRSQQKGWTSNPTSIDLYSLLEKYVCLFTEAAKEKTINLTNEVSKGIRVIGDENQIELIFRNLIHNAVKFTQEGGSIQLDAQQEAGFVKVNVTDTGLGMSKEQVGTLFRVNHTISTNGTQGERGTGLGLQLCHEMAAQNGGRIEVISKEREGSTFHVFLKLRKKTSD